MAEGGFYPWKIQKIQQPKNGLPGTCRYADLSKPLPDPPEGQIWVQDDSSREWALVPVTTATADDVAVAHPSVNATDATSDVASASGGNVCAAVPVPVQPATPIISGTTPIIAGIRYHEVLPTDTFQGICLRYKVTPTELRQANRMMGSNLILAPEKLIIPSNDNNEQLNTQGSTKEEKIVSFLTKVSWTVKNKLSYSEARAYLEIADWDVNRAIDDVKEDFGWSGVQQA